MSDPLVDLQFQEFGIEPPAKSSTQGEKRGQVATTFHFNNFPGSPGDDDIGKGDNGGNNDGQPAAAGSFWSFTYYQRFFDVDTDVVMSRALNSMIPRFGTNFILNHIRPCPDLYGPWWISTTLIFTIAVASNLGGYFTLSGEGVDYHWSLDFGVVTAAASAIFAYVWLVPLVLYGLFWWRKSEENFSFIEILCAYGYSLSVYVPISLLWIIPFSLFQWILIGVGLLSSGLVLVMSLWPAVRHDRRLVAVCIMAGVLAVNALLAIGFKAVFFHTVHNVTSSPINKTGLTVTSPVTANNGLTKAVDVMKGNATS